MLIGSEGILGIITEAWMRLQDRPSFRASASVRFEGKDGFLRGARVVRALSQTGLFPTNCRLLDAGEALTSGAATGDASILVIGFESADHPLDDWMKRALECCRDGGGVVPEGAGKTRTDQAATREGAAGAWRKSFLNAPYLRDVLVRGGYITETFETSITWDRFEEFHAAVSAATSDAVERVAGAGSVSCRFTHVYPDGPAPYFTVIGPGRHDGLLDQWAEIKTAASEALQREGGSITHHHSIGRDHRPWYDKQRPDGFARALKAAKAELDPSGILNPGVLIGP
jgi:alkyldihydroxyacetonephosphate synthase